MSNIFICIHCGEKASEGQKFCKDCKTVEQRKEMCKNNKENNLKHECKICEN